LKGGRRRILCDHLVEGDFVLGVPRVICLGILLLLIAKRPFGLTPNEVRF
jgi:hypothetical protein